MKKCKIMFLTLCLFWLGSCEGDETVVYESAVERIQTCRAEFITNIEFRYTMTFFADGNAFVSCELTDFQLNKSVSSNQYYPSNSTTSGAIRLECINNHALSASAGGEFIFDVVNGLPAVTFIDTIAQPDITTVYNYVPADCETQLF